ncbi:MAG: alpha-L-fucosidase [Armatimonadetes bacterium]|nr:alpha-L-fucosidase [Armatimonadota bacterium]
MNDRDDARSEQPGAWFNEARLGLFIHWGIYSLLGRGEQVLFREHLIPSRYRRLAEEFTAPAFDADEWAGLAAEAGMKYMVLTSKHHDGFCLFDNPYTDYTSVKTAAGRDFIAEYTDACRRAGLRVGIYYSLNDFSRPVMFDGENRDPAQFEAFIEYTHNSIRTLCSNYGRIDVLWFDGAWPLTPEEWRSAEIDAMIRSLQPDVMINDRLHGRPDVYPDSPFNDGRPGYFDTSERRIAGSPIGRPWEGCDVMQHRWWGYIAHEAHHKSPAELIYLLGDLAGRGANFLANVGPAGDGSFPDEAKRQLEALGRFTRKNGEALYGTAGASHLFEFSTTGVMTQRDDVLYLWVQWWHGETLHLCGLANEVLGARVLGEDISVRVEREGEHIYLRDLPAEPPDPVCTVIALELDGEPRAYEWAAHRLWGDDPTVYAAWARS